MTRDTTFGADVGVDHHLSEIQQVAADLRAGRTDASPERAAPGRLRIAAGTALIRVGELLAGRATSRSAGISRTPLASH